MPFLLVTIGRAVFERKADADFIAMSDKRNIVVRKTFKEYCMVELRLSKCYVCMDGCKGFYNIADLVGVATV